MYSDPVQALREACKAMATDTTVTTQLWNDLAGGSVRGKTELNKWDRIAQGVFTLSLARKSVGLYSRYLLEAVYYPPIIELKATKELSGKMISQHVYEILNRKIDRWFIDDICRDYFGLRRHHTDEWWRDHTQRSERKIRMDKNEKILPTLDGLHDTLISEIDQPFRANGIIDHE